MFENKKVGGIGGGALNKSVTIELESQKLAPGCWTWAAGPGLIRANGILALRQRDFAPPPAVLFP